MRVCAWQRLKQLCLMRAATASGLKREETAMEMRSTRRIVTGHDARGKAIVLFDDMATVKQRGANGITLFWVTSEFPVDAAGAADRAQTPVGVPPPGNGTVFRVVDFAPASPHAAPVDHVEILRAMGMDPATQGYGRHANTAPDQNHRLCDRTRRRD